MGEVRVGILFVPVFPGQSRFTGFTDLCPYVPENLILVFVCRLFTSHKISDDTNI